MLSNNFPFVFFFANLGHLAVIWFGGLQVIAPAPDHRRAHRLQHLPRFLLMPILTIGFLAAQISRAGASSLRIFEILDAPLEVADAPGAAPLPPVAGRVEFRRRPFPLPGSEREILRGVSFTAEPGQTVAILGTTGSGKSTLVNLIPRFYDVTGGERARRRPRRARA